jgi:hypothetical protein
MQCLDGFPTRYIGQTEAPRLLNANTTVKRSKKCPLMNGRGHKLVVLTIHLSTAISYRKRL